MINNPTTVVVTTQSGNEYTVTGDWEPPRFNIESIYLVGNDITEHIRKTASIWDNISLLAETACREREIEYAEYLKEIRKENGE